MNWPSSFWKRFWKKAIDDRADVAAVGIGGPLGATLGFEYIPNPSPGLVGIALISGSALLVGLTSGGKAASAFTAGRRSVTKDRMDKVFARLESEGLKKQRDQLKLQYDLFELKQITYRGFDGKRDAILKVTRQG